MSRWSEQRRSNVTNNGFGFDCVSFMALASPHRWWEIEEFFPEDSEAVLAKEREVRALPHQDDSIVLCGSCGMRPDELALDAERIRFKEYTSLELFDIRLEKLGLTKASVKRLAAILAREALELEALDKRRIKTLEAKRAANRKMPVLSDLVPLTGDLVAPGPDYAKAVRKQKSLDRKAMFEQVGSQLRTIEEIKKMDEDRRKADQERREAAMRKPINCVLCAREITTGHVWDNQYMCNACFNEHCRGK